MATSQASTSTATKVQTYSVRLPKDVNSQKKYSLMKFNISNNVDFTKCGMAKIERENNFKEFKSANDIELLPKFGAGSEFGREQREEARKKKLGVRIRKYNIEDQPYLLKLGSGKQLRRFKGTREGGVSENTSFYIFMQCPDGCTFEAHPVDDWYTFTPLARYKFLNSEEAEEQFNRRDKTLNYFSIMVKNKLKNEEGSAGADAEEGETGKKKSNKKDRSLTLTEFDDWHDLSDDEDREGSDNENDDDRDDKSTKRGKAKVRSKKGSKKKANSDDEAVEESDDVDEGQEDLVDYMSGSSSDDESMFDEKDREKSDKYAEKGVEDEEGLRKLVDSGDEEDDDDDKKDDENDEDDVKDDKKESDSESSSGSDSDSDPEKGNNFASALFMPQEKKPPSKQEAAGETSGVSNSRPSTPALDGTSKTKKRKGESPATVPKKAKTEPTTSPPPSAQPGATLPGSDNAMLEKLRSYLMRKPMTALELVQKIKSKYPNLEKEELTSTMGNILKRLNPQRIMINNKLHFQLK